MDRLLDSWMILGLALFLSVGCRTMTGQSAGRSFDDAGITASIKTKLATDQRVVTLTRVQVTTVENTVYLSGILSSEEEKRQAEEIARRVNGVKAVVNNIEVRP